MLPRQFVRDVRAIRIQDIDPAGTADNASDDGKETYISQNDITSLYNEPRSTSTTVLSSRAVQIRDILSTFSRNNFPSEHVKANIFDRIAFLEAPKAIEECVEKEDLISTIFLLAVNNWAQYRILRHVLPEELCAQYFQQKLQRRINTQIQTFDALDLAASGANPPQQDQIQAQVGMIAAELNHIVMVIREDRGSRRQGEAETAIHLIQMMQAVCIRNYRPGERFTGRYGSNHNSTLFDILFISTSSREARFGIDALEVFSKEAITEQYERLKIVRQLLAENGATPGYVRQFDEITGTSVE